MRQAYPLTIALAALLSLGFPQTARSGEPTLVQAFDHTAHCRGREYVIGRDLLLSQGERLRPLLASRRDDDFWGARQLAAALAVRLDHPDRTKALREALSLYRVSLHLDESAPGRIELRGSRMMPNGSLEPHRFIVGSDDVPLLVEIVREHGLSGPRDSPGQLAAGGAVSGLGLLGARDAVPALVEMLDAGWGGDYEAAYVAFVGIGDAARTGLLARLRAAAVGPPGTVEERNALFGSCRAARALGRLGGAEAEALLLERLPEMEQAEQVEAVARALLDLGSVPGLAAVFARQVAFLAQRHLRRPSDSTDDLVKVRVLREVLTGAGTRIEPFLRERVAPGNSLPDRVLAEGLLFEIDRPGEAADFYRACGREAMAAWGGAPFGPDPTPEEEIATGRERFWSEERRYRVGPWPAPVPEALQKEAAFVFAGAADLEWLARRQADALGDEIVAAALLGPLRDAPAGEVPLLLADRGDPAVLDLFAKLLDLPDPPRPVVYLPQLVEAMLRLGDAKAIPLLRRIVSNAGSGPYGYRTKEALPLARAALEFFEAGDADLGALLESPEPAVRLAAARALSRAGDVRALDVLLDAVQSDPDDEYPRLRPSILRLGTAALPGIAARREVAGELLMRVILDALRFRLERSDRARHVDREVESSVPRSRRIKGSQLTDYLGAGEALAKRLEPADRPILEEIALFPPGYGQSRVGLFTLTGLGEEASIPVAVRVARTDREAAVAALTRFGPAGIEAAKKIPPPNPALPAFAGRGRRHTAAAETLARAGDPLAVEKILETLTASEPEEYKEMQAARRETVESLKLAAGIHDERFVEPVIHLLQTTRWNDVRLAAFEVIGFYTDERIVSLCLPHVPASSDQYDAALRALVRQLGPEVGAFLLDRFQGAPDEPTKLRYARALARLRTHGVYRGYRDTAPDDVQARAEAVAGTEGLALEALGSLLRTASVTTRREAADELARMALFERTTAPLELLVPWLPTETEPPQSAVYRLWEMKVPGAAEAFLASYRAGGCRVGYLAEGLGKLGYLPALPALEEGLALRLAEGAEHWHGIPEIEALTRLGEKGRERVLRLLDSDASVDVRVGAAYGLGEAKFTPAFPAAEKLLKELLAAGLSPDGQHAREQEATRLRMVAHALTWMSPEKAHRSLSLLLVAEKDERLGIILLDTLTDLTWRHPGIRPEPAELK